MSKICGRWWQYDYIWAEVEFFKDEKGFYFNVKQASYSTDGLFYKTKEECEEAALKFTEKRLKDIKSIWELGNE